MFHTKPRRSLLRLELDQSYIFAILAACSIETVVDGLTGSVIIKILIDEETSDEHH